MTRARNTADTQTASGGPVPPGAAGKNAVINGGMDIWQRGTSSSTATSGAYSTVDRFLINLSGTTTASQDTDVPTGVPVQYSLKFLTGASSSYGGWYHALESAMVRPLRGQTVTVSFYVKTAGSFSGNLNLYIDYSNSTDALASQTTNVTTLVFAGSSVTSWTRKSVTFTVPSDALGLRLYFFNSAVQASGVSSWTTGVQLEVGSTATTFSRAGGTIAGELAACQRYFLRLGKTVAYQKYGNGYQQTTTSSAFAIPFNTMRATPTVTLSTGTTFYIEYGNNSQVAGISASAGDISPTSFKFTITSGAFGTAGYGCLLNDGSAATSSIDISAEL